MPKKTRQDTTPARLPSRERLRSTPRSPESQKAHVNGESEDTKSKDDATGNGKNVSNGDLQQARPGNSAAADGDKNNKAPKRRLDTDDAQDAAVGEPAPKVARTGVKAVGASQLPAGPSAAGAPSQESAPGRGLMGIVAPTDFGGSLNAQAAMRNPHIRAGNDTQSDGFFIPGRIFRTHMYERALQDHGDDAYSPCRWQDLGCPCCDDRRRGCRVEGGYSRAADIPRACIKYRFGIIVAVLEANYVAVPLFTHGGDGMLDRSDPYKNCHISVQDHRLDLNPFPKQTPHEPLVTGNMRPGSPVIKKESCAWITFPFSFYFKQPVKWEGDLTPASTIRLLKIWNEWAHRNTGEVQGGDTALNRYRQRSRNDNPAATRSRATRADPTTNAHEGVDTRAARNETPASGGTSPRRSARLAGGEPSVAKTPSAGTTSPPSNGDDQARADARERRTSPRTRNRRS